MLLLCIGPDTFRARRKANELERAFREKHDPSGCGMERVASGKAAVGEILERAQMISLFNPRRFIRTDNLLSECPKNQLAALAKTLARDPEHVIIVSVEDEPPASSSFQAFSEAHKLVRYEFPVLQGQAFLAYVVTLAQELQLASTHPLLRRIADKTDGDSWAAWNELLKLAAGGEQALVHNEEQSVDLFARSDQLLQKKSAWRQVLTQPDRSVASQALSTFISQTHSAIRVRDHATEGMKPFVVRKLQQLHIQEPEATLAALYLSLLMQRSGFGDELEALSMVE